MSWREALEPERYELFEGPAYVFAQPSRRALLQALGGGVLVVCLLRALPAQERGRGRGEEPDELGAWLHVGADGKLTAFSGKAEVGQGTRTALTVVVAEELGLAPEAVELVMADTALVPYDRGTFGSRSMPDMAPQLARAAAAMRELLVDLAQERWQTERAAITVAGGRVVHPDGQQALAFAELTKDRELVKSIAAETPVTAPEDWNLRGKPARRVGASAVVTGTHRYASDVRLPGMLYGKVLRLASFGAKLVSVELDAARALAGVTVVHDGDFVGVAAPDEPMAERALQALRAQWESRPQPSHRELFALLKQPPPERAEGRGSRGGRSSRETKGSIERGLELADVKLQATYTVAYIAHAPLETRAALAEWQGDALNVWTGTQRPFGVREELARAFGIPEEQIRVRVPDTGSGYGGKHSGEAALEAARLARAAQKPVKVVWTREEEFTWAYLRPAGVIEVESGARRDGKLTAWRFHNYNSGSSAIEPVYAVPNLETEYHASDAPLRQGSYRALAATANHFARETHLDELARALGMDPLALRLANLDDPRQRAVLEAAAQRFGWGGERSSGHGVGLACGFEKGGYVATCAQVAVSGKSVRVERLVAAFECGAIVEPAGLETQVEGALIMGLGGALFEQIEFEGGRILNPRFSRYRVPRFTDVPKIETVLLDRRDLPSAGAGEAPIVAVAPAIGNALFDASGERRRALPML